MRLPGTRDIRLAAILCTMGVLTGLTLWADSQDARQARLLAMPLPQRRELARDLQRFESLSRQEQETLRGLDAQIEGQDPETQARLRSVARLYRSWLERLEPARRREIESAAAADRIVLVRKALADHPIDALAAFDTVLAKTTALNPALLLDQAHWIRIWLACSGEERAEINGMAPGARIGALENLGRSKQISDDRQIVIRRMEQKANQQIDTLLQRSSASRLRESLSKAPQRRELLLKGIELEFLRGFRPEPVAPRDIERFVAALPEWLLASLDSLPPEAADLRLRLLYRLIFPPPNELPDTVEAVDLPAPEPLKPSPRAVDPANRPRPGGSARPRPF